jgi:enoyl-CoA hydratase
MDSSSGLVLYAQSGPVVTITLNRPEVANAQNSALLYELDDAFHAFAQSDEAAVAILVGAGRHFSAGHDLGRGADRDTSFPRRSMWWDHVGKPGVEGRMSRESEVYLGLCRRWREIPKPTVAQVTGACVAGGLMLAWSCDLIYASTDAYFADPVVAMGMPGHEFFAHPWILGPRQAKEFLFLGEKVTASEALRLGMVNRVFEPDVLEAETIALAERIAAMPRMGLALTKLAVNQAEDAMGLRVGMDSVFGLHQAAHAHNVESTGSAIRGRTREEIRAVVEGRPWLTDGAVP